MGNFISKNNHWLNLLMFIYIKYLKYYQEFMMNKKSINPEFKKPGCCCLAG